MLLGRTSLGADHQAFGCFTGVLTVLCRLASADFGGRLRGFQFVPGLPIDEQRFLALAVHFGEPRLAQQFVDAIRRGLRAHRRRSGLFSRKSHQFGEIFGAGEGLRNIVIPLPHRPGNCVLRIVVLERRIGARIQQALGQRGMAFARGHHDDGGTVGGTGVDVGTRADQRINQPAMAGEGRIVEGGPLSFAAVRLGTMGEQPAHGFSTVLPGRVHQGGFAEAVGAIQIRSAQVKQFHEGNIAFPGADHRAGADQVTFEVRVEPRIKPFLGLFQVAEFQHVGKTHWVG